MNIYDVFEFTYKSLKLFGFFPMTINFKSKQLKTWKTTFKDKIFFVISLIVYSFGALVNLQGPTFMSLADSKISQSGFILWRYTIYANAFVMPILCFVHRKRLFAIIKIIYFVDEKV